MAEYETEGNKKMIFRQQVFVLEFNPTMPFKEKLRWRKKVTDNGGTVSYIVAKKVSFVVLFNEMLEKKTFKVKQARQYGIPVLRSEFIDDCLQKQQLQSVTVYYAGQAVDGKNFKNGKIAALHKQKLVKRRRKQVILNNLECWPIGDPDAPAYDEDNFEVAKWSLLKSKTNVQVLEVHVSMELKCSKYRIYSQTGSLDSQQDLTAVEGPVIYQDLTAVEGPVVWFVDTSDEALSAYEQLYRRYTSSPYSMEQWNSPTFSKNNLGSSKFRLIIGELCALSTQLTPEVGGLVELVWTEASREAVKQIDMELRHIKPEKVEDAEAALLQLKRETMALADDRKLSSLLDDFYSAMPHKADYRKDKFSINDISAKLDLCQLVHDIIDVSEATDWSESATTLAKFRALRCHVTSLDQSAEEYLAIKEMISQTSENIEIQNIFRVGRTTEDINFLSEIGNVRLLMHSSDTHNFLGILSRGLLLPNFVEEEHGISRTDKGLLGCGIYFSDSARKCAEYSEPSTEFGCRLMMFCDVALGNVCDYTKMDSTLTAPPDGYHSTHGVKRSLARMSQFEDDEYVVYDPRQQKMRYVVEFHLSGDEVSPLSSISQTLEDSNVETEEEVLADLSKIDISDVKDLPDPLQKVSAGLMTDAKKSVPLKSVHIRAQLLDMVAQVVVMQKYRNDNNSPMEAKYVFPLDDTAAVCGFEAFINGKHIIGKVKEKSTAHKEYKEAISKGHGAYLMDEEEPDVFTVSVGNLPPKSDVLIKITYIAELQVEGDSIAFRIPATVAPWVKDTALAQQTQSFMDTMKIQDGDRSSLSLQVAIEMPFDIRKVTSPTHPVKYKKTATKAVVELPKNSHLDDGFILLVTLAEIHVPRMWVEQHPDRDSQACMLAFYPEFEAATEAEQEIIFLLDMSNSMKGQSARDAKKVMLLALEHLPEKSVFNIIKFGTSTVELFPAPQRKNKQVIEKSLQFVQAAEPKLGGSNASYPAECLLLLSPPEGSRSVFFISDGYIANSDMLISTVQKGLVGNRIFTLGVGGSVNHHLMRTMATRGGGTYQYYNYKTRSAWQHRMKSQIEKACQPGISGVEVEWCQHSDNIPAPQQAPQNIPSLFNGSRLVVYGFTTNCTEARLKAVVDGIEMTTMVSTTELNITSGKILHQLTARAIIRDYEDGILSEDKIQQRILKLERKKQIVDLSTEYSIVTPYTSFVAVEERDKEEEKIDGPSIEELVSKETIDILPYIGWQNPDIFDDKDPTDIVEELLRKGSIAENFSQMEAQRCYVSILDYLSELRKPENVDLKEKVLDEVGRFCSQSDSEQSQTILKKFTSTLPRTKKYVIKSLTGRMFDVRVDANLTVLELKQQIFAKEGITVDQCRLICNGSEQLNHVPLSAIAETDSLRLIERLRGGASHPSAVYADTCINKSAAPRRMYLAQRGFQATRGGGPRGVLRGRGGGAAGFRGARFSRGGAFPAVNVLKGRPRIRRSRQLEDKYLSQVNLQTAYFDPKARSMAGRSVLDKYYPPDFDEVYSSGRQITAPYMGNANEVNVMETDTHYGNSPMDLELSVDGNLCLEEVLAGDVQEKAGNTEVQNQGFSLPELGNANEIFTNKMEPEMASESEIDMLFDFSNEELIGTSSKPEAQLHPPTCSSKPIFKMRKEPDSGSVLNLMKIKSANAYHAPGKQLASKAARKSAPVCEEDEDDSENEEDSEDENEEDIGVSQKKPVCLSQSSNPPKMQIATKAARKSAPVCKDDEDDSNSVEDSEDENEEDTGLSQKNPVFLNQFYAPKMHVATKAARKSAPVCEEEEDDLEVDEDEEIELSKNEPEFFSPLSKQSKPLMADVISRHTKISYNATSPSYSPTSPSYSPTSPTYGKSRKSKSSVFPEVQQTSTTSQVRKSEELITPVVRLEDQPLTGEVLSRSIKPTNYLNIPTPLFDLLNSSAGQKDGSTSIATGFSCGFGTGTKATPTDAPGFSFGAQLPSNTFGSGTGTQATPTVATGFNFGAQPPSTTFGFGTGTQATPTVATGFNFGAQPPSTTFGFGTGTQATPTVATGFSFGAQPPSTTFGFGTGTQATPTVATGFSFGAQPPSTTFGSGTGTQATPTVATGFSFGAQLPSNTFGFGTGTQATPTVAPGFSFGAQPLQSSAYSFNSEAQVTPSSVATGFNFGAWPLPPPPPASSAFGFGSGTQESQSASKGFSFGVPPQQSSAFDLSPRGLTTPSSIASGFGFGKGAPPPTIFGFGSEVKESPLCYSNDTSFGKATTIAATMQGFASQPGYGGKSFNLGNQQQQQSSSLFGGSGLTVGSSLPQSIYSNQLHAARDAAAKITQRMCRKSRKKSKNKSDARTNTSRELYVRNDNNLNSQHRDASPSGRTPLYIGHSSDQSPGRSRSKDFSPRRSRSREISPSSSRSRDFSPRGRRRRDFSPSRSRSRDFSPRGSPSGRTPIYIGDSSDQSPRRSRNKDFSPRRSRSREISPSSSRSRDFSRRGRRRRDFSPSRSRSRDFSPRGSPSGRTPIYIGDSSDQSPGRSRSKDFSPRRGRSREISPSSSRSRDFSPRERRRRDFSPSRSRSRDFSPRRSRSRDFSPRRRRRRDFSPRRSRSGDFSPRRRRKRDFSPRRSRSSDFSSRHSRSRDFSPRRKRSRDLSPRRSRNRDFSPRHSRSRDFSPRRRRSRDFSPRRRRSRDFSPRRSRSRDFSPRRRRSRDFSPRRSRNRDFSPRRSRNRDFSPRRSRNRDFSPRRNRNRDFSPRLRRSRDFSPRRSKSRDFSPRRNRSRDFSPRRRRNRDFSPRRRRNRDFSPGDSRSLDYSPRQRSRKFSPKQGRKRDFSPTCRRRRDSRSLLRVKSHRDKTLLSKKHKETSSGSRREKEKRSSRSLSADILQIAHQLLEQTYNMAVEESGDMGPWSGIREKKLDGNAAILPDAEEGKYWELNEDLCKYGKLSYTRIIDVLRYQGLYSLGHTVSDIGERILATLIVFIIAFKEKCKYVYSFDPCSEINELTLDDYTLSYEFEDNGLRISLHGPEDMTYTIGLGRHYQGPFHWLLDMAKQYSTLYRELELGKDKNAFLWNLCRVL